MGSSGEQRKARKASNITAVRAVHREKVSMNDLFLVSYKLPAFNSSFRSAAGRKGCVFTSSNSCLGVLITSDTLRES